jgi:hypothetical protein
VEASELVSWRFEFKVKSSTGKFTLKNKNKIKKFCEKWRQLFPILIVI